MMNSAVINFTLSLSGRYMVTCDMLGKMTVFDLLEGETLNEFVAPEKNADGIENQKNLKIHDMSFSFD